MQLVNIGFGSLISVERLIAVVSPDSAPVKRLVQEARDRGMLIDATFGRKTASVFIMDSDHVVLSALSTEKMAPRLGLTVKDLTWESAADAKTYNVYRKVDGASGWTLLASSVSGTTYKDTSGKSGTTYAYTVRGVAADGKTLSRTYNTDGLRATMP